MRNKSKNCSNKKLKCQLCGNFFFKKWLTIHIELENDGFTNSKHCKYPQMNLSPMCQKNQRIIKEDFWLDHIF